MTNFKHFLEHEVLPVERRGHIHFVKGVLLQYGKVDQFASPVSEVIIEGYTIITQDVDLFVGFFASEEDVFSFEYVFCPVWRNFFIQVGCNFRVFEVF